MKKFFARLISATLVFVLLFSVPVQAESWPEQLLGFELPTSYNYSMDLFVSIDMHGDVDDDIAAVFGLFDNGLGLVISGAHVRDGLASSDFMQIEFINLGNIIAALPLNIPIIPMIRLMGIDLTEPIRIWAETDFNNLLTPEFKVVIELPPVLQLALLTVDESLSRQFLVLDFGYLLDALLVELEAEIRIISDEQAEDFMIYLEEAIQELMLVFADFRVDFNEWMVEEWEEVEEFFTVRLFEHGTERLENAARVFLSTDFTISDDIASADFIVEFNAAITNINSAERVPLPLLTPENSVNLLR
ncbi:MAG: hypothetical protein FWB80_03240 [Defluviitaleaceae bacterium]|nr:hypothetical protein [Defluviitaleaceae bacterium]